MYMCNCITYRRDSKKKYEPGENWQSHVSELDLVYTICCVLSGSLIAKVLLPNKHKTVTNYTQIG